MGDKIIKSKNLCCQPVVFPSLSLLRFIGKLSSDYGLLSKMKSNLEDLYLNIKQCILILLKNYTIWSHNLVLLLVEKRTLLSKIPAVSAHESKSSAAGPNFGRGFNTVMRWGISACNSAFSREYIRQFSLVAVARFSRSRYWRWNAYKVTPTPPMMFVNGCNSWISSIIDWFLG